MNPQEADDASLLLETGSFGGISVSTGSTSDDSSDNSSKPYYKRLTPSSSATVTSSRSQRSSRHYPSKRRKPNRMLLYVFNRTLNTNRSACSVSAYVIATILIAITVHRLLSIFFTHRRWINAPITYMHRTCPAPQYELLFPQQLPRTLLEQQQQVLQSQSLQQPPVSSSSSSSSSSTSDVGTSRTNNETLSSSTTTSSSPPLKICITSLTDQKSPSLVQRMTRWRNFDGIMKLTLPNKMAYAQKYGYYLFDGSDQYDPSRPPAWSKIRAVQYLLDAPESCDWVLWMDADTVIMNSNIRIEDFLPADPTKDLIVVSDKNGGYNSGVFLFRNSKWSKEFLDEWWNMNDFVRPPGLSLSGDNAALKALLRTMEERNIFKDHVLAPPRCTINSFAHFLTLGESMYVMDHLTEQDWYYDNEHYHKGDFIAHIPGFDNKAECLKLLLREAR
jgi:hypothetical protein